MNGSSYASAQQAANHVVHRIKTLSPGASGELSSTARSELAKLRRALGKPLSSSFDSLSVTLANFPQESVAGDEPTVAEYAVHLALTCYGAHQQSRNSSMHVDGLNFGTAVRILADRDRGGDSSKTAYETSAWKAFERITRTRTPEIMGVHLRGLIQRLRAAEVAFDYGQLTKDLYSMQFEDGAKVVALRWTRDFNRTPSAESTTADGTSESN
ncbi:type I-E CRISPR-associated protein Cse2/CasB [Micrococcales bacterium 31B]|nr:type I-E CRISPR-associated protein Cse2/CasB [Micrococcales bacterium 31B]